MESVGLNLTTVYVYWDFISRNFENAGSANCFAIFNFREYVACVSTCVSADKLCGLYFRKCRLTHKI